MWNQKLTAGQAAKITQCLSDVDSGVFQCRGFPLIHLLAEYLRQEQPKSISLVVTRQVLGLPTRTELGVANVEWTKAIPSQRLGDFAVRPSGQKKMYTQVARLFPEDLGLVSTEVFPAQVLERALEWGFQLIPLEAFKSLIAICYGGQVVPGDAMAYIDDQGRGHCSVRLINYAEGHGFQTGAAMERGPARDLPENWSILVAAETTEAK